MDETVGWAVDDTVGWAVSVPRGYRVDTWRVVEPVASGSWGSVYRGELAAPDGPVAEASVAVAGTDAQETPAASGASRAPDTPDTAGLPTQAALKFIPTGTLSVRQLAHVKAMVTRETELHRRLRHPRLVRLYQALTVDEADRPDLDGATVLVMDMADESLDDLVRRSHGPVPDAERLIVQVCEGIAFLHSREWIHGDLKPANILRMADGSIQLSDFGLAAELDGTHGYLPRYGSLDYAPAERFAVPLTERGAAVRTTLDVWALGVTAHILLAGRHPFPGPTVRARVAAVSEYVAGRCGLSLAPEISPGWRAFVADCLAQDHETRRRHTAEDLLGRARRLAETGGSPDADASPAPGPAIAATIAGTAPSPTEGQSGTSLPDTQLPEIHGTDRHGTVSPGPSRRRPRMRVTVGAAGLLLSAAAATTITMVILPGGEQPTPLGTRPPSAATESGGTDVARWLNTEAGIAAEYYRLIIQAGTICDDPHISPALVAAMLEAESGFDPNLSDPARDEYGIARWTPQVLQYYLPPGQRSVTPKPPFSPEESIPAVGRYLCVLAPQLEEVPGTPELLLAAAYRSSADSVRNAGGIPARWVKYTERVAQNLVRYRPRGQTG